MKIQGIRHFFLLTLIAFIMNAIIPFYAVYADGNNQSLADSPLAINGKILLCTSEGFQLVSLEDIEQNNLPAPHEGFKCPLCYISAKHTKHITTQHSQTISYVPYHTYYHYSLITDDSSYTSIADYAHGCRAPPAFSTTI